MKKTIRLFAILLAVMVLLGSCGNRGTENQGGNSAGGNQSSAQSSKSASSQSSSSSSQGAGITIDMSNASRDVISNVKKDDALFDMLPDYAKEKGIIVNGFDDAYPPMSFRTDDNTLVGWDVDFGNAVAAKLGIKIDWIPADFAGIVTGVQTGKYDFSLSALTITEERAEMIDFSEDYFFSGATVIVRTDSTKEITCVEDLAGKTVGVQLGSSSETKLQELDYVTDVKTYATITDELMDLMNGRLDAVVEGLPVAMYYSAQTEGITAVDTINSYPYGVAFNKGEDGQKLRAAWNAAVKALGQDGTLDLITDKWFGAPYDEGHFGMPH